MSTVSDTRLATGLEIHDLGCLVEIQIGEDLFVSISSVQPTQCLIRLSRRARYQFLVD